MCATSARKDVAPDDYRKANREGFPDKIDEIRATLNCPTVSERVQCTAMDSTHAHKFLCFFT